MLIVVTGHWVMQGVYVDTDGGLQRQGLLGLARWTHPLTWLLQVMPLIFLVGGGRLLERSVLAPSLGNWGVPRARLGRRVRRLTRPLLPLMLF